MDNASKALIMAGAILVAVMIISLAVFLFNAGANNTRDLNDNLTTREVLQYNQRYTVYLGAYISGADAKTLLNVIDQHNNNVEELSYYGKIQKLGDTTSSKDVLVTKKYKAEISSYDSQGAISGISITKVN